MKIHFFILLFCTSLPGLHAQVSPKTALPVPVRQFFVDPSGNDANPGSAAQPWKTLDKANRELRAGDMVILRDGSYEGIINPEADGESRQKQIIYRSENRHGAVLTGREGSRYIINLTGKNFIVIDGFKMLPKRGGFGFIKESNYITLQNCHMENSSEVYCPLEFIDGDRHRMLFNNMTRVIQRTSDSKIHGDGCHFINSSYNLIEGNAFSRIGHSPLRIWPTTPNRANYNVIRGNVFHNGWGRNFELFNLDRSLFEGNIITKAFNGAMSADALGKVFLTDGIFRHCLIHNNWDNVLASNSYIDGPTTGDVPLELKDTRIYNNTFADNPTYAWSFGGSAEHMPIRSNVFKNNLFYRNDYFGDFVTFSMVRPGVATDNIFHNNLFYGDKKNQAIVRTRDNRYGARDLNDKMAKSRGNTDADPKFVDAENHFYALKEGSGAIHAGDHLTTTSRTGSGRIIPVSDARYFYDGFGIDGEKGDLIVIGPKKTMARVVKSDIVKNELAVDRNIQWKAGDPVDLPYSGGAPDIGAVQFNNSGILNSLISATPAIANPGGTVAFTAMISGSKGKEKMEWDLGDGTVSNEKAPKHQYKESGEYIVRLRCTDASGETANSIFLVTVEEKPGSGEPLMSTGFEEEDFEEWGHLWDRGPVRGRNSYYPEMRDDGKGQCMCVSTEASNTTLATNVKVWQWDIDKHPIVRFSYRIPKGVPVGVWVDPWPSENCPPQVCLGGTSNNSAGNLPDIKVLNLIDDGRWHMAEVDVRKVREIIPNIKFLKVFGFSTQAKTEQGQKFWFDDFSISR